MPRSSLVVVPRQQVEPEPPNRYNLPVQLTSLIGRGPEAAAARQLLLREDIHLLTMIGPPGIGKTRLSLLVAEELFGQFSDGVCFVPLAPISDPGLVVPAIVRSLGLKEAVGQSATDTLKDYLFPRRLLLVLDNFEQVAEAASQVSALILACPGVKALITSRVALHLYGEQEFPVPTLALPDPHHLSPFEELSRYEAVALFVQRARLVKPNFDIIQANAQAVAEICLRLDGLPLAIELAAARSKFLSPQALLSKFEHRLDVLTAGPRDLPARQQTLLNAIEWSYDLLDQEEQRFFRGLSVFVGGCTLEAVEAVCESGVRDQGSESAISDPALASAFTPPVPGDTLASLIDKSLLKHEETGNGEQRYWMLETIREYGLHKLAQHGEEDDLRRRHAEYYLTLAERAEPNLIGSTQVAWLDKLEAEHENLRAVLNWAVENGEANLILRIGVTIRQYWNWRAPLNEGRYWMETALALDNTEFPQPIIVESATGLDAIATSQSAIRVPSRPPKSAIDPTRLALRARAVNGTGLIAREQGDLNRARDLFNERLAISQHLGDKRGIAGALVNLGLVAMDQSDFENALALHQQSLALFRELDDKQGIARELLNLGEVADGLGNYEQAVRYYEESLALFPDRDEKTGLVVTLYGLGKTLLAQGNLQRAAVELKDSLVTARELGTKYYIARCLLALADLSLAFGSSKGRREERPVIRLAALLLGAAQTIGEEGGLSSPTWRADIALGKATIQEKLDEADFGAAWDLGVRMTVDEVVTLASTVPNTKYQLPRGSASLTTPNPELATHKFGGLTARQQDVARLIAQGKTNREIADILIVGKRTVEMHVENILSALGFSSRTQIAIWAVDTGLVQRAEINQLFN